MPDSYNRRDFLATFLKGAGCFTVAAGVPFLSGCVPEPRPLPGRFRFPQGLASGDPTPDSVVLWSRVEAADGSRDPVEVVLQVSLTEDFGRLVAERRLVATPEGDHTLRVLVTELQPDTIYAYRFLAGGDATPVVGRTRTAPEPTADRPIRMAFASCQAYEAGYYGMWRTLLNEDVAAPQDERIDVVLHLGDFVYEGLGYGEARSVPPFPSGGGGGGADGIGSYAVTLDDYRHLYRTYLSDPDLQAARARWPFIVTWDDHEFSDDAWQSVSTYTTPGTPDQARKVAANQAWFEYIPAFLTGHPGSSGVEGEARDFTPVEVASGPLAGEVDEAGLDQDPANLAAIGSLAIYRSFRFGRHVELAVTDTRSYRSQHCIPGEILTEISGTARYIAPLSLVRTLDAGREADGGNPPARVRVGEREFANPRREAPPGTLLGARQKDWLKRLLAASDATWRILGTSVPLMPMRLDLDAVDPAAETAVFTIDTWDGYQHEREELLRSAVRSGAGPLISLTGDNHNHFAGLLTPDFDAPELEPMGVEFAVAGISSPSVWSALAAFLGPDAPLRPLVVHDSTPFGGTETEVEALNLTFLEGAAAAMTAARTGDLEAAREARNPAHNRHLRYVDSAGYGVGVLMARGDRVEVQVLGTAAPLLPRGSEGEPLLRRTRFTVRRSAHDGNPGGMSGGGFGGMSGGVRLEGPSFEGEPPYPFRSWRRGVAEGSEG